MTLGDISRRLADEGLLRSAPDFDEPSGSIEGVTSDSREVRPGVLFCAVRGTTADGHEFLESVQAKGAAAAMVEDPRPDLALPQFVVRDGRRAAAEAAAVFYGDPWDDMTVVGVTGTNGKTTTVSILRHLLSGRGPTASVGTLGLIGPDGKTVPGSEGLTTPGPVQFAAEMRSLADQGVELVAMEVSSHALHQDRVGAATFSAGIFTNLSRDHLDYHKTLDEYRRAKLRLVELIRPGGVIALNADDPAWEGVEREGVHRVRYGTEGTGDVVAEDIRFGPEGVQWKLFTPSCTADVVLPLFGSYNVSNALGAAAALWGLGWTADEIAERLATLDQVPGRLEHVSISGGPTVLIDYAHTPDALAGALAAVRPLVKGRLIVVFGAGGDRDRGKRPEMGSVAVEGADVAIVTTDNPRHEDPAGIADEIEAGMGGGDHVRILDRREAIAHAIEIGGADDVVLIAGKGHETYQIWGDEKRPFDERAIVKEIAREMGRDS